MGRLQDKLAIAHGHRKPVIHFDSMPAFKGLKWLNPLYNYISRRQTLRITYKSFSSKQPQEYILCPYLLKELRNRWFVFGGRMTGHVPQGAVPPLCNLALDRIVSIEPSDAPYTENPEFDPEHFFDGVIGVSKSPRSKPRTIRFLALPKHANYIKTKPLHRSKRLLEDRTDGTTVFEIDVVVNFELYSVLMSHDPGIKVLSPPFVQQHIRDQLHQAAAGYEIEDE